MKLCQRIDEEIIELHAMNRLRDGFIREHLDHCSYCSLRVNESRVWIEGLKCFLESLKAENPPGVCSSIGKREQSEPFKNAS
jgi:hypothetical protein